ncbi:MAG: sugar transferase, partial [Roseimicrobium sp.]
MKATLICPSDRSAVAFFARRRPLALAPLLGRSALDRAMSELAQRGVKQVRVLAADRPEQVRAALRHGRAWGIEAQVVPVPREMHPEEVADTDLVVSLDHWPSLPHMALWESAEQWFALLIKRMGDAGHDTVGMREIQPGVWISTKARISSSARLLPPCWIGHHANIASGTTIGPSSVIEKNAYVDAGAEVVESFVGPSTYIGNLVEVRSSLAWGNGLLNWRTNSFTEVRDSFLMADLSQRARRQGVGHLVSRACAGVALALSLPMFALAALVCLVRRKPLFIERRCVHAPIYDEPVLAGTVSWYRLNCVPRMWARLPELWNILRGEFAWFGNRPLTPEQAEEFTSEFERLWLAVPPGLLSLADAHGCGDDPASDTARAHAAYFTVHASWRQ